MGAELRRFALDRCLRLAEGVNDPAGHLSGPQPLQSVVDPFDRLVLDRPGG
jgi:hypothetical protein